jgi:hypothetical protein
VRVTDRDTDDAYVADQWAPRALREAQSLKRDLSRLLGCPVHVYPVVVFWGRCDAGQQYVDEVSFVHGDKLVEWLQSRPADLLTSEKRAAAARAVRSLPRASELRLQCEVAQAASGTRVRGSSNVRVLTFMYARRILPNAPPALAAGG